MNHSPGLHHPNRTEEQATLDMLARKQLYPQSRLELVRTLLETAERELRRLQDNIPPHGGREPEDLAHDAYDALQELMDSLDNTTALLPHAERCLNDWCQREAEEEYLRPAMGVRR